jgi:hypothetical protein
MEKQIIEMSEEILQEYTNCYSETDQECLEKMLRKLASDLAEEIFAELDTFIVTKVIDHETLKYDIGDKYKALKKKYSVALPTIAELKKKYTQEK